MCINLHTFCFRLIQVLEKKRNQLFWIYSALLTWGRKLLLHGFLGLTLASVSLAWNSIYPKLVEIFSSTLPFQVRDRNMFGYTISNRLVIFFKFLKCVTLTLLPSNFRSLYYSWSFGLNNNYGQTWKEMDSL